MIWVKWIILTAVLSIVLWNGIQIKVGNVFSSELYSLGRFFNDGNEWLGWIITVAASFLFLTASCWITWFFHWVTERSWH